MRCPLPKYKILCFAYFGLLGPLLCSWHIYCGLHTSVNIHWMCCTARSESTVLKIEYHVKNVHCLFVLTCWCIFATIKAEKISLTFIVGRYYNYVSEHFHKNFQLHLAQILETRTPTANLIVYKLRPMRIIVFDPTQKWLLSPPKYLIVCAHSKNIYAPTQKYHPINWIEHTVHF